MTGFGIIEFALAATPFLTVIVSSIAIYYQSKAAHRQITATIISANRQKWIDAFREDVAELIALIDDFELHRSSFTADKTAEGLKIAQKRFEYKHQAQIILNRIRLRLNESEPDSHDIVGYLQSSTAEMRLDIRVRENIINTSQRLIKAEWEKIKKLK